MPEGFPHERRHNLSKGRGWRNGGQGGGTTAKSGGCYPKRYMAYPKINIVQGAGRRLGGSTIPKTEFPEEARQVRPLQTQCFRSARLVTLGLEEGRPEEIALEIDDRLPV